MGGWGMDRELKYKVKQDLLHLEERVKHSGEEMMPERILLSQVS